MRKLFWIVLVIAVGSLLTARYWFPRIPKPDYTNLGPGTICDPIPEFAKYSTASGSGALTLPINFDSNNKAREIADEIWAATPSGINFAAENMLVKASCGPDCISHAIVAKNGNILLYGLRSKEDLSFRPDSSLIIVNSTPRVYYYLAGPELHYICEF